MGVVSRTGSSPSWRTALETHGRSYATRNRFLPTSPGTVYEYISRIVRNPAREQTEYSDTTIRPHAFSENDPSKVFTS